MDNNNASTYKTFYFKILSLPSDGSVLKDHMEAMSAYFMVNNILGTVSYEEPGVFFVHVTNEKMQFIQKDLANDGISIAIEAPDIVGKIPAEVLEEFEKIAQELYHS